MNSGHDGNLISLLELVDAYSGRECKAKELQEIYDEVSACLNGYSYLYFEGQTLLYFDLIYRLASIFGRSVVGLIQKVDELFCIVDCQKSKLFFLDLIVQFKTRGDISLRLSEETNKRIESILKKDPWSERRIVQTLPKKRNRREEPVIQVGLNKNFLTLVRYLICLPLRILNPDSSPDIEKYCIVLTKFTTILQDDGKDEIGLQRKFYVKLISCMNLIWSRYPIGAKNELPDSSVLFPIVSKIPNYFRDQEACDSWMELLYLSEKIKGTDTNYLYLPDNLNDTVLMGTEHIKKTYLKLFDHYNIKKFKDFVEYSQSSDAPDLKFIGEVFLIGINKFHCLTNKEFTDWVASFSVLFDIYRFDILPDYCFELLILYYKRALTINAMDSFAETVNDRLHKEMRKMNLESLYRIGDYLGVILHHPKVSTLAKKWVDRVIEQQILDSGVDTDRLYCLFIVLSPIGSFPKDHLNKKNSYKQIKELTKKLDALFKRIKRSGKDVIHLVYSLCNIAYLACKRHKSIRSLNDSNFSECKDLFTKFSALLLQIQSKLQSARRITFNITKSKLKTMNEHELVQEYKEFKQNFSIKTDLKIELVLNSVPNQRKKASKRVDIRKTFMSQSVLKFFRTTLIWEGVKRLLRYVTTYYMSKRRDVKRSVIGKLNDWSSNLLSIAKSDLFRYLSSELNEAGKAYITQQIFLCATHQTKSFLKLMSSAIKFYYLEPTNAIDYDTSLLNVIDSEIIKDVKKLLNPKLNHRALLALPDRVFYGPLDSKTDGETLYGGYIILNNRYKNRDPLSKASAKVVLVHELAHLIMRFEGNSYNFMKTSTTNSIRIQIPGAGNKYTTKPKNEIGEYIETQVFGFTVKYINKATIEFLNDHQSWMKNLAMFQNEFTSCIEDMTEEKILLKRFRYEEKSPINNTRNCVYRHLGFFKEE